MPRHLTTNDIPSLGSSNIYTNGLNIVGNVVKLGGALTEEQTHIVVDSSHALLIGDGVNNFAYFSNDTLNASYTDGTWYGSIQAAPFASLITINDNAGHFTGVQALFQEGVMKTLIEASHYDSGTDTTTKTTITLVPTSITLTGDTIFSKLTGTGYRIVTADATGKLSASTLTVSNGLTYGGTTGSFKLGGTLTNLTTISQNNNALMFQQEASKNYALFDVDYKESKYTSEDDTLEGYMHQSYMFIDWYLKEGENQQSALSQSASNLAFHTNFGTEHRTGFVFEMGMFTLSNMNVNTHENSIESDYNGIRLMVKDASYPFNEPHGLKILIDGDISLTKYDQYRYDGDTKMALYIGEDGKLKYGALFAPEYTNGLTHDIVNGKVKLGGALIEDTNINLGTYTIFINDSEFNFFEWNPATSYLNLELYAHEKPSSSSRLEMLSSGMSFITTDWQTGGSTAQFNAYQANNDYDQPASTIMESYHSTSDVYSGLKTKAGQTLGANTTASMYVRQENTFYNEIKATNTGLSLKAGASEAAGKGLTVNTSGDVVVDNLIGTGIRMVIVDANGVLSTQVIPSGGGSDTYVTSASFNTSTGVLTLTKNNAATVTVDLDGKYQDALSGSGLVKSTSGTISYVTDNSSNWNIAYSWGNHASAGYSILPSQAGNSGKFLTTNGSTLSWSTVSGGSGNYSSSLVIIYDADYTIQAGDTDVILDSLTAVRNLTLPDPSTNENRVLTIKHSGAGLPDVQLNLYIRENASVTTNLLAQGEWFRIIAKSGEWWLIENR